MKASQRNVSMFSQDAMDKLDSFSQASQSMISALIVNYHCANLTCASVASVLAENLNVEVIVVDNSADDDELKRLRQILPPEVTLLSNMQNNGFGKACNWAYQHSQGDMILLLNPDAHLLPGALAQMQTTLLNHPDAGAVGPKVYWDINKKFLLPPSIFPSPLYNLIMGKAGIFCGLLHKIYSAIFRYNSIRYWLASKPLLQSALSGGHMLLSRQAIEQSGGLFDEQFFMYFEDTDLILRLRKTGYKLYFEPRAECVHHYQHSANKMQMMHVSGPQFYAKHFHNSIFFRLSTRLSNRTVDFDNIISLEKTLIAIDFPVPLILREHWLFEFGFSDSFVPSIGYFGSGEVASIPEECWKLLHPGRYFIRISKPTLWRNKNICWTFEIPDPEENLR
jgi:GT2 family glycosyltransferase